MHMLMCESAGVEYIILMKWFIKCGGNVFIQPKGENNVKIRQFGEEGKGEFPPLCSHETMKNRLNLIDTLNTMSFHFNGRRLFSAGRRLL